MDITTILFTVAVLLLSTIFLLIKNKNYGIILIHLIVMMFAFYIGIALVFPENAMFGLFVSLYCVAAFIANILMIEV